MNFRAWTFFGFLALALLDAVSASALSGRVIRFIVPVPAGASTDFIARLMAAQVGATEGVDLVVENRPGASGMIGTEFVSRQAPDGNTVLFTPGTYLIDAQTRKAPYHPVNDFAPLCSLVQSPAVLAVPQSSPYRSLADLLKDAGNGLVRVIGEGKNRWPCVYARDLADAYARVAANPEASGVFHVNDEADESVGDIVDSIANHVRMRPDVRHVPITEARAKMGAYADALALDQLVRSPRARALGWAPTLHSVSGNVARLLEEFRARREAA